MKKTTTILLLASFLASCGTPVSPEEKNEKIVRVEQIQKAPFSDEIRIPGKISARLETAVSAQISGTLKNISVSIGQKVKAGTPLASIDLTNSSISASYRSAQDVYANALNSFTATKEAIRNDLESARIQLENAKISRDNLYRSTEPTLTTLRAQLADINGSAQKGSVSDASKTALSSFVKTSQANLDALQKKLDNTYTTLRSTLQSAQTTFQKAINQADIILGITDANRDANRDYRAYLSAKDSVRLIRAKELFYPASDAFSAWQYNATTKAALDDSLESMITVSDAMANLYLQLYLVMQATIPGGSFSQANLDALTLSVTSIQGSAGLGASTVLGAQNILASTRTSIEDMKNSLEQLRITQETTTSTLSNNVGLTKSQLEASQASLLASRDGADNAVKIAQSQYDSARARSTSSLSASQQALAGSRGQKDIASAQFANTKITAPFDGVILSRSGDVGSLVNPGTPVFYMGDDSGFRIKSDVPAETAALLRIGQEFVAQKDFIQTKAVIETIAPGIDPITRMVRVEFSLDKKDGFRWGDYVDLIGTSQTQEVVLSVPFSALITQGQGDFQVWTVSGGTVRAVDVKVGEQNSSRAKILSGLSVGDVVVIRGATTLRDGDSVRIDQKIMSQEASPLSERK